jgi:hypothetical protein
MPPGVERLMRFQPLAALATGLACILLLRRGLDYIPVAALCVLFAFIYITLRPFLFRENAATMTVKLSDLAIIYLINDMLLFVTPFYFESMTFTSRNAVFAILLAGLVVTVNWYTLYERRVLRSPLTGSLFYALAFFCVLNFIFPVIFGMRNIWSLALSGILAGGMVIVFMYPAAGAGNGGNRLRLFAGVAAALIALWSGRSLIPPSPLRMTYATACAEISGYRPVLPFDSIKAQEMLEVYFYSSIFAPRGLSERVDHVWFHGGRRLFTVRLSEIRGGRKEGFGTWSRHAVVEGPGKYTVEVWTAGGQLLGKKSFTVE